MSDTVSVRVPASLGVPASGQGIKAPTPAAVQAASAKNLQQSGTAGLPASATSLTNPASAASAASPSGEASTAIPSGAAIPSGLSSTSGASSTSSRTASAASRANAVNQNATVIQKPTLTNHASVPALVQQLNKYINDSGRANTFRVDPASPNQTIQEINPANGAVIGEFSVAEFPALARSLGVSGVLVDDQA